jgi:hypothetical protein
MLSATAYGSHASAFGSPASRDNQAKEYSGRDQGFGLSGSVIHKLGIDRIIETPNQVTRSRLRTY